MSTHFQEWHSVRRRYLREFIFERDLRACFYCNLPLTLSTMTIDHVVPASRGGPTDHRNLVAACARCNRDKGRMMPLDFIRVRARTTGWAVAA